MREEDTALVRSVLRSGPGIIGTAIEMHRHLVPGLPARHLVNFYKCPKSKKIFFLCFFLESFKCFYYFVYHYGSG